MGGPPAFRTLRLRMRLKPRQSALERRLHEVTKSDAGGAMLFAQNGSSMACNVYDVCMVYIYIYISLSLSIYLFKFIYLFVYLYGLKDLLGGMHGKSKS